ncbi:putative chloroperoxidase [Septoria linicola]|nr:putative chloroperoxidase [Septoria linicola]
MVGTLLTTALLLNGAVAFPQIAEMVAKQKRQGVGIPEEVIPFPEWPGTPNHATFNQFNAAQQLVSVSGDHEFRMPGPNDIRGPCAGLNAAANHGYIPRDGIATAETINTGLWEAFSLDKTATLFLQTATMFFNGDPISGKWSIGPSSPKTNSLGAVGNLLGNATGICAYGHLRSEGDASITRGDWLAPSMASNCISYPVFLQELFDVADEMADGMITPRVLAKHSSNRKKYSIANNPNYYSPPYAGVAFTFGAHMFAFQLIANHSAAEPRGFLTKEVFMDFFGYTRDGAGNLQYTFGAERIPENWYKRSEQDPWTLADITTSTAQQCATYPGNCQVGGNTGTVNSFKGVDLSDITGGFINSVEDFQDPNQLGCFISQMIQADTPSALSNVFNGVLLKQATDAIQSRLIPALAGLGNCPNVPQGKGQGEYDAPFPGANGAASGPRGVFGR